MKFDQQHLPYFNGSNLDQVAVRITENQKKSHAIVVKPEIPEGTPVQIRYPHPLEEQYMNVSIKH